MNTMSASSQFEVFVSSDTFKFNAAHFVAYQNYRERLHGHNYHVSVKLIGEHRNSSSSNDKSTSSSLTSSTTINTPILGADGYLIDFSIIKQVTRKICKELNEHFICPMHSDVLDISTITIKPHDTTNTDMNNNSTSNSSSKEASSAEEKEYIQIVCTMDHTKFIFPKNDCILLPIVHATAEELAIYIYCQILNQITINYLFTRNIYFMEITVAEAPTQQATFRHAIPTIIPNTTTTDTDAAASSSSLLYNIDVRQFIMSGNIVPMPCLPSSSPLAATTSTTAINTRPVVTDAPAVSTTTTTNTIIPTTTAEECSNTAMTKSECDCCSSSSNHFQLQLQRVVDAINDGRLLKRVVDTNHGDTTSSSNNNNESNKNNTPHLTIQDIEQLLQS